MFRTAALVGLILLWAAAPAAAQHSPPTCQSSRLHASLGLPENARDADDFAYTVTLDNVGDRACDVVDVDVTLALPGRDGNPQTTVIPVASDLNLAAGFPDVTFGPYPYTVSVDPG